MELSEAKKECKDLIEEYLSCSVIGLDMQVDVSFGEKRCEAIDTVLKALDNSISKDEVKEEMKKLEKIRDEFLSESKKHILHTEKINCCTFARNILFSLIEE